MKIEHSSLKKLSIMAAVLAASLLTVVPARAQEFVDPPEDQSVFASQNATFQVEPKFGDLRFQWIRQWPDHDEILAGQTASSLTISNAQISDVGQYLCAVSQGEQVQLTRAASLTVCVYSAPPISKKKSTLSLASTSLATMDYGGGTLTLFGGPVFSGGGSGNCPGPYLGYVNYTKPVAQGWGWAPSAGTTVHTAMDGIRTDTKIQFVGKYGDMGCNQTSVTLSNPNPNPKYRFTIFFYNNVPTNAYPITLIGFDP
jgi:hypothetical protein